MNGRGARNKGAAGERELAALLQDQLGFVVKRNLGQARDGDVERGKHKRIKQLVGTGWRWFCNKLGLRKFGSSNGGV